MKYKPKRDIPLAVRELQTTSPVEVAKWIRSHRTKRDKRTGKRTQETRRPWAISMWYKRNPAVYQKLKEEVDKSPIDQAKLSDIDFENGKFRNIECVKRWIMQLRARPAKEESINMFLGILKQICMGKLPRSKQQVKEKMAVQYIEEWGLKHPGALTLDDCLLYHSKLVEKKLATRNHRLVMRNFLKSRNVAGWDSISGKLEHAKGRYAHLYTARENIHKILEWLKPFYYDLYLASKMAYKCGGIRRNAIVEALASNVNTEDKTIVVWEKSSRNQPKRKMIKEIPDDLFEELLPRIHKGGKLFSLNQSTMGTILRNAYKEIIPELEHEIEWPFHFWRHMFAQHMLRETDWNYALVANLGGWKVQTLEDYYGAMDRREVRDYARQKMKNL